MGSSGFTGALAATVFLFASSSACSAGYDDGAPPSKAVRYGDLNLNRSADVERLYARIVFASGQVCPSSDRRSLLLQKQWKSCVAESISRAVESVNHPNLTAYRESHGGTYRLAGESPIAR